MAEAVTVVVPDVVEADGSLPLPLSVELGATATGNTEADGAEDVEPPGFVEDTVKVYNTPAVSPDTVVVVVEPSTVTGVPEGLGVTV